MSLWHANNSKEEKNSFPDLPELEPLPELDDLFDDFDSGGLLSEDNNDTLEEDNPNELPEESELPENKEEKLPKNKEERLPREVAITTSDDFMNEQNIEIEDRNAHNNTTSLPDMDLNSVNNIIEEEGESEGEDLDYYDEDLEVPDMSFEDFKMIDESEVNDPEYDRTNDEEVLHLDDDEDPYGYDLDKESGFEATLLPGVDMGEEFEPTIEENIEDSKVNSPKKHSNNKPGFKELDEEKIKAFFTGLFDKIKGNKTDKDSRIKGSKKGKTSLSNFKLNKSMLMYIGIAVVVVTLLLASFIMWGKSYKNIDDLETSIKLSEEDKDKSNVDLSNFSLNKDGDLTLDLKNNISISQDLSMYITLKGKPMIPFTGNKIGCESDIIAMEPGGKAKELLDCKGKLKKNVKYKILSVEVDEL